MEGHHLSNLKQNPKKFRQYISLVERCFEYKNGHRYQTDFYPALTRGNYENCYFIINENTNQIVSCLYTLKKFITIESNLYPVLLIGGVCTHPDYQGRGLNKELFDYVSQSFKEYLFIALWSDLKSLYKKYQFYPCIEHYSFTQSIFQKTAFEEVKLANLSEKELTQLKELYRVKQKSHLMFDRDHCFWSNLKKMDSVQLYWKKQNNKILSYFLKNKGMDLNNIIHEYTVQNENDFYDISQFGQIWGTKLEKNMLHLQAKPFMSSLVRVGSRSLLKKFLLDYYQENITKVDFESDLILITLKTGLIIELTFEELNQHVLSFSEKNDIYQLKPFFINGIDSV